MIGDLWESPNTGQIYEIGEPGKPWRPVGEADGNALLGAFAYVGAVGSLTILANVWASVMIGLLLGAALMYLPTVLPLSVPLTLLGCLVVTIRVLTRRCRLRPLVVTGAALVAFLVVAACNAVFWYGGAENIYRMLASVPIMAVSAAALAVILIGKRRKAACALLLAQAVVFALPYLDTAGESAPFAESAVRYDNVLSLTFWLFGVTLMSAWCTPRRGHIAGAPPGL